MTAIWLLARAGLRGRARDVAVLIGVAALAGAVVTASLAGARRTTTSFDRLQAIAGAPDFDVELPEPGEPDLVEEIGEIDGVAGATLAAYVAAAPEESGLVPFESTIAFAIVAEVGTGGMDNLIAQGREPDPRRADEMSVNAAMAQVAGVEVGDEVHVVSISRAQGETVFETGVEELEGDRVTATVVGIVAGAEDVADVPDPVSVFTPALLEQYDVYGAPMLLGVQVEEGRGADVYEALVERFPDGRVTPSGEFRRRIQDGLDVQALALTALAVAVGLAGLIATWGAVGRLLSPTRADDAWLGALGVTVGQRRLVAAARVAPAALGAAVLAGVLGWAAAPSALTGLAEQVEPTEGRWVDLVVLLGLPVAVAVAILVAAVASVRQPAGEARATSSLERAVLRAGLPPVVGLGVGRVVRPRPGSVPGVGRGSAIGGVVGAVAAVAAVGTFGAGIDRLLVEPNLWGARFDATAYEGFAVDELVASAEAIADDERVAAITLVTEYDAGAIAPEGRPVVFPVDAVRPISGDLGIALVDGRAPVGADEAVVGKRVLSSLDLDVGDDLELRTETGLHVLTIVGEAITYTNDSIDDGVLLSAAGGEALYGEPEDGVVNVRFAEGVGDDEGLAFLADHFGSVDPVEQPGSVDNLDEIGAVPEVLAWSVAALGAIAVGVALASTARLARRETAVLRAVGASGRQVATPVLVHGSTLAVLGIGVGVPLGVILGRLLLRFVVDGIGAVFDPVVPLVTLVVLGVGTLLAAMALAALPAWSAVRVRTGAALRAE